MLLRTRYRALMLLAAFAFLSPAQAATPESLLRAVADAPMLNAARKRVDAARSRTDAAGRWADPEFEAMASRANRPERRDMYEATLMQPLPKRGERAADRDRARAVVQMAEAEYAISAGEIAAEIAAALAEADAAEARAKVLEAQAARLDAVLRNIEARLATATSARFADRLAVQTRLAAMRLEIDEERRRAADAREEVRGRLGLAAAATLPEFWAPAVAEIDAAEAAELDASAARKAEAEAMVKMARASARPMTAVGLRLERERSAMGDGTALGFAFSTELPFRSRRYARAEVKAAEAEREAAEAESTGARYRIASAISRVERAERLAESARRVATDTRARLEAQYDALARAAGAGAAGGESVVLMTVEILEQTTATELSLIDAEAAERTARAELWRYLPAHRFLPSNL